MSILHRWLRKSFSAVEKLVVSIVVVCMISFTLKNILEGLEESLMDLGLGVGTMLGIGPSNNSSSKSEKMSNRFIGGAWCALLFPAAMIIWSVYCIVIVVRLIITAIFQVTAPIVEGLFQSIVVGFAKYIYLNGISIHGYGFWNGKLHEEICAQLTNVPAKHWAASEANMDECELIIHNNVVAIVMVCTAVIVIIVAYRYVIRLIDRELCHRDDPPSPSQLSQAIKATSKSHPSATLPLHTQLALSARGEHYRRLVQRSVSDNEIMARSH